MSFTLYTRADSPEWRRCGFAHTQMKNIALSIEQYKREFGRFPSTQEGLNALVDKEILLKIPESPWRTPYQYESNNDVFLLSTLGSDGRSGGTGMATDFTFGTDEEKWFSECKSENYKMNLLLLVVGMALLLLPIGIIIKKSGNNS